MELWRNTWITENKEWLIREIIEAIYNNIQWTRDRCQGGVSVRVAHGCSHAILPAIAHTIPAYFDFLE
jgi:hypothetical protein